MHQVTFGSADKWHACPSSCTRSGTTCIVFEQFGTEFAIINATGQNSFDSMADLVWTLIADLVWTPNAIFAETLAVGFEHI